MNGRDGLFKRSPAGRAEPLKAGELKLYTDTIAADRGDDRAAVGRYGAGGSLNRRLAGDAVDGLDRRPPEPGRVGVETDDELTLSFLNERGEPVAERLRAICDQPPLTVFLSFAPAENRGTLLAAIWMRSPVWGLTP
jgi:hypothetical protein